MTYLYPHTKKELLMTAMPRILLGTMMALAFGTLPALAANPTFGNNPSSGQSPIVVNDCQFFYRGNLLVGVVDGVRIEYTNESNHTANLIDFLVQSGQRSVLIRDEGKFSPGIEIIHKFRKQTGAAIYSPLFSHPKITCRAEEVHFSDGTTWRYGQTPTASTMAFLQLGAILKNTSAGVTIATVAPGGPFAEAGLNQNDRILSFGGNVVHTISDITLVLSITKAGADSRGQRNSWFSILAGVRYCNVLRGR